MKVQGAACWVQGAVLGAGCLVLTVAPVQAQGIEPSRFEVSVGPAWTGAVTFSPVDANETGNGGDPFRLFASQSALGPSAVVEGTVAFRVSRWLQLEGIGSYGKPEVTTRVTDDFEGAPDITIAERTLQVAVQGALVAHIPRWRLGSRAVPFMTAGGGYLRELHEGRTIAKTGRSYFAGAGLRYWFAVRPGSRVKAIGLRSDARVVVRTGGIAFDGGTHVSPALGVALFLGF